MQVVILAGGYGTRISEESIFKPKPMIEIGEKPILWHIMKGYSHWGFNDFIICCGYKQHIIKEWFANYYLYNSDVTFDFCNSNHMTVHNNVAEPWKVTLVDTGLHTLTGGRLKRIQNYIEGDSFMLTYGDGVSDVNIRKLVSFHERQKKLVTITAVNQIQRFGVLEFDENDGVRSFSEKAGSDDSRINAGFMVVDTAVLDMIQGGDSNNFEEDVLPILVQKGQVNAYKHDGFWQCMDTKREKEMLDNMWIKGEAPWKLW